MKRRIQGVKTASSPRHSPWGILSILLAIIVMASPMLIGGVHASTAAAIGIVAVAGLWWSLVFPDTTGDQTPAFILSIPAIAFASMAVFCLIQLIPLPTGLYRLVQPVGYESLTTSWEIAFEESFTSGWHLLSLDPRQTTTHALRWIALSATAALAAQVVANRHRRRRWFGLLLITGAVIAAVGSIQHFSGTDKILGIYEAQIHARSISPFVSTNHAATYYALMALIGISYGLDNLRRSAVHASLGAVAATTAILLSAAHGSDGAILALAAGIAVLGISVITRSSLGSESGRHRLRVGAVALFLVAVVAVLFVPQEWTVAEEDESLWDGTSAEVRIHMGHSAINATGDFLVFGSGAGSIERVLAPYMDWGYLGASTIPTIENEPIEWAMTLGPMALIVALMFFVVVVARTAPQVVRRRGRRGPVTAFAVVIFLAIISLFHFPFATLGISIVAVVAIEGSLDSSRDGLHRKGSTSMAMIFVLGLTIAIGGLLLARATVLSPGAEATHQVDEEMQVRRALHLYPTDGVLLSAMSLNDRAAGDHHRALRLARRAFEVRPHPQQQFLLAGSLANAEEHHEAAQVYQDLLHRDRHSTGTMYRWASPRLRGDLLDASLRATALAEASPTQWHRFSRELENQEGHQAAIDFVLALVELRPTRPEAHLALISSYERAEQVELAEMYARMLIAQDLVGPDGERPAGLVFLLDLLHGQDRYQEARSIAHRAFVAGYGSAELSRKVIDLLLPDRLADLHQDRLPLFEAALDAGCVPPYEEGHRRTCWRAQAFFAEGAGEIDRATDYLRRIDRLYDDPRLLGALLARHGLCRDLASLERQYRGERFHGSLKRNAADCARAFD